MRTPHEKAVISEMIKSTRRGAERLKNSVNILIKVWTHCHGGHTEDPNVEVRVWRSDTEIGKSFLTLDEAYNYINSFPPKIAVIGEAPGRKEAAHHDP